MCVCEREIEKERETDRQTDILTEAERQTDLHRYRESVVLVGRDTKIKRLEFCCSNI